MKFADDETPLSSSESDIESTPPVKIADKKTKKETKKPQHIVDPEEDLDIELYALELDKKLGIVNTIPLDVPPTSASFFSVTPRLLDAELEVKKMFGSKIVSQDSHRARNAPRVKKRTLAQMKENWPRNTACGITMSRIDSDTNSFKFDHSILYNKIQHKFIDASETHDPTSISKINSMLL